MPKPSFHIRADQLDFRLFLCTGLLLVVLDSWLIYQIAAGKNVWLELLATTLWAAGSLLIAVARYSTFLSYRDKVLTKQSYFVKRSVSLTDLALVDESPQVNIPGVIFTFEDKTGHRLEFTPSQYRLEDQITIFNTLAPYVQDPNVVKNFDPLRYYFSGDMTPLPPGPPIKISRILVGTFAFIFLPAATITAALLLWAYFTHHLML